MSNFTQEEITRLILALGRGQETFTEADAVKVIGWAEEQRMSWAIVENVLNGDAVISIEDGELKFRLSDKGLASVEESLGVSK